MVWKNITDDEICETFNIDKEIIVLDRVKKLPDDIIKKIFQYVKCPFNFMKYHLKKEIKKRKKNSFLGIGIHDFAISDWRQYTRIPPPKDKPNVFINNIKEQLNSVYINKFYGIKCYWSHLVVVDFVKLKEIRKIGYENGVKGRSKKEIIQKLMKL